MKPDKTGDEDRAAEAVESQFLPFYENWAEWIGKRLGVPVVGKLIASLIPGLVFFVIHFLCTRGDLSGPPIAQFHAWSWMIGVMTICCLLSLYFATHAFKGLFPQIDVWQAPDRRRLYLDRLNRRLSDRNFVLAGTLFGALNMLMGYWFGVPYTAIAGQVSIYLGFFLVGFVCGMAAWGICGVLVTISVIVRQGLLNLDFTAPDRCGGTKFLGEAFVKFSAVTLIMGGDDLDLYPVCGLVEAVRPTRSGGNGPLDRVALSALGRGLRSPGGRCQSETQGLQARTGADSPQRAGTTAYATGR